MNLMDIELLSAPPSPTEPLMGWLMLALGCGLLVFLLSLALWRKRNATTYQLKRLKKQLKQGEPVPSIALAVFKLVQSRLALSSEQHHQLNQACFSAQCVSRETLENLINQLIKTSKERNQ